ncbi:hypothetical protein AALP_AA7G187400 [Arabis alpina]|uniref:Uncharacterized protein n=1 Tax=Arabis alpina TaxID=50452 RepID=A0A087GJ01_ARAAL|nr:hypothetical protein AALP_AA7G187400 [Arabis alpina]
MDMSNKKSATMALKEGKREPEDNLETIVNLKKQKKDDENKTLISDKAKNETEDNSKDGRAETTSSLVSSNKRLEVRTKRGKRAAYTPQSRIGGNDDQTIIVKGFDSLLPEDDIKSALRCAYIELKEGVEKALKLNGSYLGGWNLVVEKVSRITDRSGKESDWPYPYRCKGLRACDAMPCC